MNKWSNGVVGLVSALLAGSSMAQTVTYDVRYPIDASVPDINGTLGANTARPAMGALRMAIRSFSERRIPDELPLLQDCQARSTNNFWPEGCNPNGMVSAFNSGGHGYWLVHTYEDGNKAQALAQQVSAIKYYKTPNVVPIYGQADHWVMVHKMLVNASTGAIQSVQFRDGGPEGSVDSGDSSYEDGPRSAGGRIWPDMYFKVITSVPASDTYYNKLVLLWDPPLGSASRSPEPYRAEPAYSPLPRGEPLTPALVQRVAHDALRLGGLVDDEDMWNVFARATPALPYEVHGVHADGRDWNYFLVPFLDDQGTLVSMALLDAQDASYQQAWVLARPRPFLALGLEQARAQAVSRAGLKRSERLEDGLLTWDPSAPGTLSRSPMRPYYAFRVTGPRGEVQRSISVRLDTGEVQELGPCQSSRRLSSTACAR